ncbi:MAG: acylphosphatase, partial [Aeromonas sp.]
MNTRKLVEISGIVQGVGFRPFVYGLALTHRLTGWVRNDAQGVTIEVQGAEGPLHAFIEALQSKAPPLSRIDRCVVSTLAPSADEQGFAIHQSHQSGSASACISPDQGACAACLADVANPADRHHRYPFTNCTHCGPRYTIIRRLPYDRPA